MKKWLGVLAILLCASAVWAAGAKMYPGAQQDMAATGQFQSMKANSSPDLQAKMGQQTFYTTTDSFAQVYGFYKKLYPETDIKIRKSGVPLSGGAKLNDAYFCLDGAKSVSRSKSWLKIQHPFVTTNANHSPKIENITVITVVSK